MAHAYDATLKDIFTPSPEDIVSAFGLSTIRPVVALNVDLSTISAATDVAIGLGEPLQEIVDLNFQSGPDPKLAGRCHLYNAALHYRFGLPVRSVVVLMRPKADAGGITGKLYYSCGPNEVQFAYDVIRMWEQSTELFLKAGVNALPLATLCKLAPERSVIDELRDVFREIERRLETECERGHAAKLMTAAFILLEMRTQGENMGTIITKEMLREVAPSLERLERMVAALPYQRAVLRLGTKRFGPPTSQQADTVRMLDDIDQIERITDALFAASSWEEALATR